MAITDETTLDSYTDNLLTQNCIDTWGKRLEALNWNEMLCLLNLISSALGDPNEELSDAACMAAEEVVKVDELEGIVLVRALYDLMDGSVCHTLTSYTSNEWAVEASDTWGDRLADLGMNDCGWILYNLTYSLFSNENIFHEDEIARLSEWLEDGGLTDYDELIKTGRALSELAQEQYQKDPSPFFWVGEYEPVLLPDTN